MSVQSVAYTIDLLTGAGSPVVFAEPDWRGQADDHAPETTLRPLCRIERQIDQLSGWIAAGEEYGWLGAYRARRAGFDLRSIIAHQEHETTLNGGRLPDAARRAVQSRLDRLEACLRAARGGAGVG